jgi:hypothetical protein
LEGQRNKRDPFFSFFFPFVILPTSEQHTPFRAVPQWFLGCWWGVAWVVVVTSGPFSLLASGTWDSGLELRVTIALLPCFLEVPAVYGQLQLEGNWGVFTCPVHARIPISGISSSTFAGLSANFPVPACLGLLGPRAVHLSDRVKRQLLWSSPWVKVGAYYWWMGWLKQGQGKGPCHSTRKGTDKNFIPTKLGAALSLWRLKMA